MNTQLAGRALEGTGSHERRDHVHAVRCHEGLPEPGTTVQALRGVDLVIEDGEWLAIQGPTGHGKTTLLQMLGGIDRPTSGMVEFDGRDLARLGEGALTTVRAQSFGFIFQTFNLIPTLTAKENVETALVPLRVSGAGRRARAAAALADVGLS